MNKQTPLLVDYILSFAVVYMIIKCILIILPPFFTYTQSCYLIKTPSIYKEEKVEQITYKNSFIEGDYCIIKTNKDIYTIYDEDCTRNKIGKSLTFMIWENTCKGL